MVKKLLYFLLASTFFLLTSCNVSPTYSRQEIKPVIRKMCKEEFGLDVNVWLKGDTLWVYAPLKLVDNNGELRIDEEGKLEDSLSNEIRSIFLAIQRISMSVDKPPKFYCLVTSDTEKYGIDFYRIGFILDLMKSSNWIISQKEIARRSISFHFFTPQAIGDKEGKHLQPYDISIKEFLALLIEKNLHQEFSSPKIRKNFNLKDITVNYNYSEFAITLDLIPLESKKPSLSGIKIAEEIIRGTLQTYSSFIDIKKITIYDTFHTQTHTFVCKLSPRRSISPKERKSYPNTLTKLYRINFYLTQGNICYKNDKLDEAKSFYEKALKVSSQESYGYFGLGNVLYSYFLYRGALSHYKKILLALDLGLPSESYREALAYYNQAISLNPHHPGLYYNRGLTYLALGKSKKAIADFHTVYKKQPQYLRALYQLGLAYYSHGENLLISGKPEEAKPFLEKALQCFQDALGQIEEIIAKEPPQSEPYIVRGLIYLYLWEFQRRYTRRGNPSFLNSHYYRETIPKAIASFKKALAIDPSSLEALLNLGYIYKVQEDYENALLYYQRVLDTNPQNLSASLNIGDIYLLTSRYQKAISSFEESLKLRKNLPEVYIEIGFAYQSLYQYSKAIKYFKKSLLYFPKNPYALYSLGYTYLNLSQFEKAKIYLEKTIQLAPKCGDTYRGLGLVYLKLHRYQEAKENLRKAKELFLKRENYPAVQQVDVLLKKIP